MKLFEVTPGPISADEVILEVVPVYRSVFREQDILARYGGDEFIAFLRNTPLSKAETIGESIRTKIEGHNFTRNNVCIQPTISIGVAEISTDRQAPEDLVKLADEALYRAKEAGRNTVSR